MTRRVPRVLWTEARGPALDGVPLALRGAVPSFDGRDGRVAFAAERADLEAAGLELIDWAAGESLPRAADPRWARAAFVAAPTARAGDVVATLRRSLLDQACGDGAKHLAAALAGFERPASRWSLRGRELALERGRPIVMAVLNATPDSFSDGGRWNTRSAIERGVELAAQGARIVDVGGESTRPGSEPIAAQLELERVLPVIEGIARRSDVALSIDTTKAAVAEAALAAGAVIVNDTSALADDPALATVVARAGAGLVLMHRLAPPRTMQDAPRYEDCAAEVADALAERAAFAVESGIAPASIVLDPGIGFGKRLEDNLDLVAAIGSLRSLGFPVLLGASRKGFLGALTGRPASGRDAATLATTAVAFAAGCEIVRVHDAASTLDFLRVLSACAGPERAE